jgi:hypothetical protein
MCAVAIHFRFHAHAQLHTHRGCTKESSPGGAGGGTVFCMTCPPEGERQSTHWIHVSQASSTDVHSTLVISPMLNQACVRTPTPDTH